jgi:hypothetical protein
VVESSPRTVNASTPPNPQNVPAIERLPIDFAFLRQQITLEQVLRHLGLFDDLRGRAAQLRGRCPFHEGDRRQRTLSLQGSHGWWPASSRRENGGRRR